MPGLFGIYAKTQKLSESQLRKMGSRMAESMQCASWLLTEIWASPAFCGGRVHLGVVHPAPQPLVTKDQLTRVWIDGEMFIPPAGTSNRNPSAEELYELRGGAAARLAEIDGAFVFACFNEHTRELTLANDRLGFRPLYYTETADWFAYASEVKALLAIKEKLPELDEVSLRQFFGLDHMLGERTWWKGIELIPPASLWRISATGRAAHVYWSFDEIRRHPQSLDEVQEAFGRLWAEDVRRHSRRGPMPLFLSGGLDSRLLLAELLAQGADVVAITYGSRESPEVKPACLSAKAAGVAHRLLCLDTDNWWQGREHAIWRTDGLVNGNHLHPAIATDEVHLGECYSPMNIAGDMLFGGSHLVRTTPRDWHGAPEQLIESQYGSNPFFSRDEVLAISVNDAVRYANGPSSDCFHLRQRYRRYVLHSPGCLSAHCEFGFPGLSLALLQLFLGALTDEERFNHKFYNRFLVARHPRYFADIPWQGTGRGLAETFFVRLVRSAKKKTRDFLNTLGTRYPRYFGAGPQSGNGPKLANRLPMRVTREVTNRVRRRITNREVATNQWFVNFPESIRKHRVRERLVGEDLLADAYLGGAATRVLSDPQGRSLPAQSVIAILTFETYLRQVAGMPSLGDFTSSHRRSSG